MELLSPPHPAFASQDTHEEQGRNPLGQLPLLPLGRTRDSVTLWDIGHHPVDCRI